jgi:hypothetical protein
MVPMREETFVCNCTSLDHAIRLTYWPEDRDGLLYIDFILRADRSFWKRVATAIRYVFNRTCRYGEVCEMLLNPADVKRLHDQVLAVMATDVE